MENFTLPGEPGFPLNSLYAAPASRLDAGEHLFLARKPRLELFIGHGSCGMV